MRVAHRGTQSLLFPARAFLLAGGKGERLRPITDHIPKCLAPINDVPLLAIWLDLCARCGITNVLLNVSQHVEQVERFLHGDRSGVNVHLVSEVVPVGTAGTVRAQREFVADAESFFILYADNLTDAALDALAIHHACHDAPLTMGLFHTPTPHAAGIVQLQEDGLITAFDEKPAAPAGDLANAGIYLARQSIFDFIPNRDGVVDFGLDVLPSLTGRMHGYVIEEYLMDIGTPTALERASREWLQHRAAAPAAESVSR